MNNTLFDKIFRDSNGEIVIAQMPNLPIIVWIAASLLKLIFPTGEINTWLELMAFLLLFTLAWVEIIERVKYFRSTLGLVVFIGLMASRTVGLNVLGF